MEVGTTGRMPDDDYSEEHDDSDTDTCDGLVGTLPSGEGDIYWTRGKWADSVVSQDASGMARWGGPLNLSEVN